MSKTGMTEVPYPWSDWDDGPDKESGLSNTALNGNSAEHTRVLVEKGETAPKTVLLLSDGTWLEVEEA